MQKVLGDYCAAGGRLIVSGANVASDIWNNLYVAQDSTNLNPAVNETAKSFASNKLKYKWEANHASHNGVVKSIQNPFGFPANASYRFYTQPNQFRYHVEAPDGISPAGSNCYTIMRYAENNVSAAVAYKGSNYRVVTLGFPIETLTSQDQIDSLITSIMKFLMK
ncbi:MAG: hypothetical protein HUJ93_06335 [Bacteroidales bacterium]|nr:hypothetical protein [Bacteroidales bacterium]